jgi:hypothetical protein
MNDWIDLWVHVSSSFSERHFPTERDRKEVGEGKQSQGLATKRGRRAELLFGANVNWYYQHVFRICCSRLLVVLLLLLSHL